MPKGKKKAGGAAPGAGDVDFIEDDDPTDMPSAAAAPAKPGMAKFTTSPTLDDGSWRPSGELRKKKGGKGWKKRWCHLEGTKFWYGADKRYLEHGGRGAKWFEVKDSELKNVDSLTFTIVPSSGPNAGEDMIFQALDMNSKRLPDWTDAIKEILGILPEDSSDDDD